MKYLVTGGAGFIGYHVANSLLDDGHKVVILDNLNSYYDPNIKKERVANLRQRGAKAYIKDVADESSVDAIFDLEEFDKVCHLAAQAGVRYSIKNPSLYHNSNVKGTLNILEACKNNGIDTLVLASSSSVYGNRTDGKPFSESDNTDNPVSAYAQSKKTNELQAHVYYHLKQIPNITALRFFTVYGPMGRPDMAISSFTKNIIEGEPIQVFNNGESYRDYTYISDIVDGVKKSLEAPLGYQIINLGNTNPVKTLDMISMLEKHIGKKAIKEFLPAQQGDVEKTYADIKKARNLLNWNPKISLDDGLERFVNWYKENNKR